VDDYEERLHAKLLEFTRKGDALELQRVEQSEDEQVCELCGHEGIRWLHWLANLRTGKSLIVGSRCIVNYRTIYENLYNQPLIIRAPASLAPAAQRINRSAPGTIVVARAAVASDQAADDDFDWDEDYDEKDEDLDDVDVNDAAPEGLGPDEMDWETGSTLPDDQDEE
jgi:hypothetical protein